MQRHSSIEWVPAIGSGAVSERVLLRKGKLQLAIGKPVCIGEARRPENWFPAFNPLLLNFATPG
jgi:hypothetical protein